MWHTTKFRLLSALGLFVAAVWLSPLPASAVTATVAATPSTYTGSCPTTVSFQGTIFGPPSTPTSYYFSYYDPGAKKTHTHSNSGKIGPAGFLAVTSSGSMTGSGTGSVTLFVTAPASAQSNTANITVTCSGGLTTPTPKPTPKSTPPPHAALRAPTHLRPVQSKADCIAAFGAAALGFAVAICDAAVRHGDLQLIWRESSKNVTGYEIYRVDEGRHDLVGTTQSKLYVISKPSKGYDGACYAVEAYAGKQTSKESSHYCYRPGATASTESFEPSHTVTVVRWSAPSVSNCSYTIPISAFFQAGDKTGNFTALFPWLVNESNLTGRASTSGVFAGNEAAIFGLNYSEGPFAVCSQGQLSSATVQVSANAGAAFDLAKLAKHKVYSASLTLDASRTVTFVARKFTLQNGSGPRCNVGVAAATRAWTKAPVGNLTYNRSEQVYIYGKPGPVDVTKIVSTWASHEDADDHGFIVTNLLPPGAVPITSSACLTKFSKPKLNVVYF